MRSFELVDNVESSSSRSAKDELDALRDDLLKENGSFRCIASEAAKYRVSCSQNNNGSETLPSFPCRIPGLPAASTRSIDYRVVIIKSSNSRGSRWSNVSWRK